MLLYINGLIIGTQVRDGSSKEGLRYLSAWASVDEVASKHDVRVRRVGEAWQMGCRVRRTKSRLQTFLAATCVPRHNLPSTNLLLIDIPVPSTAVEDEMPHTTAFSPPTTR